MDYETYLVARLRDVFSDLKEVEERLDSEPEAFLPPTFRSEEIAPPCVRTNDPCAARASKSERMVACDRSNRSLRSTTDTRPLRSSKSMICSRRSWRNNLVFTRRRNVLRF